MNVVWKDELDQVKPEGVMPESQTLLEALLKDSTFKYIDNINTAQKETLFDDITTALQEAIPVLQKEEKDGKLEWAKHQDPTIFHLLKTITAFAKEGLPVGGGGDIINATTHEHGPSWRMIVQLSSKTEAYGVFPGGESGNPGSKYYDNFVDKWAKGEYYLLWMMQRTDGKDPKVKWTMTMSNE
jgi:penicillin amidase